MWKKVKFLGSGAYSEVHLAIAEDSLFLSSPSIAAVKTAESENSLSLRREAEFLKELRGNPFIIQGYGEDISLEENGDYCYNLLMEHAAGGDLNDLIEDYKGIMPEYLVAWYTYMLLKGLSEIHSKGLVHCDIKPGNILVFPSQQGLIRLKIADFGLSKQEEEKILEFRGTWYYGAPESLQRRTIQGTAADIWSLGCVVLQMMNGGNYIWKAEDRFEAEVPEYVSELGKDFLKNCFQVDAGSRWTADMLLNHPFIEENVGAMEGFELTGLFPTHKKGSKWMRTEGMFSSRPTTAMEQCAAKCYELFPQGSDMLVC